MEIVEGRIVEVTPYGITIRAPLPNHLVHRQYETVQIALEDGRTISPEQRRKAYALLGEIASFSGDETERIKTITKHDFVRDHLEGLRQELFSLGNCDMTTAREYISYLINLVLEYDVPTKVPLITLCDDVQRYMYACLKHKKCAVCGKKADLHHVDSVGMGNDRTRIDHVGMLAMPLCREHHQESHQLGEEAFAGRYHLEAVTITEEIAKIYKLGRKMNG